MLGLQAHSCRLVLGAFASVIAILGGPATASADAAPTTSVDLGAASSYAVLSGASVGNTVSAPGAPHTTLRGDLGVKANTQPTGFPPGVVTGSVRVGSAADQAHADLVSAYGEVAARTGGTPLAGALAGTTISPGLHTIAGATSNTTTVTLDGGGDPNAVFVFQVNGALAFAAGSEVKLINGAEASRVFWQVNGAGAIGANAKFAGTLMAMDAVAIGNGSLVNGRAFARNGALTLDANEFYSSPPALEIAGGAAAYTTDTTPTISGTTDVEAPSVVSVTVAGQTLTATPSGGAWSVTSAMLANGGYQVAASVSDEAGNTSSDTQLLTVDTVLPVVTLDNGASDLTNDQTPTVSGTSDAAVDTVVRVTVGGQNLRALVHAGGAWNIRPISLADGTHRVDAYVRDPAGNEGTDSQDLTVDTTAPAVTITGGANASTNDPTPVISGTADIAPGAQVAITLADETLTAPVGGGGAWSATAAALADGPHRIVVTVSDAAGNPASFTQTLTVDTTGPATNITGGPAESSTDTDGNVRFSFTSENGATFECSIDASAFDPCASPKDDNGLSEGSHTFKVRASDDLGNTGLASSRTFTVDRPDESPDGGDPGTGGNPRDDGIADDEITDLDVTAKKKQKQKGKRIKVKVSVGAEEQITATASGFIKIKRTKGKIELSGQTKQVEGGERTVLKLKVADKKEAKKVKKAIKKYKKASRKKEKIAIKAPVVVEVTDATGNAETEKRVIGLA